MTSGSTSLPRAVISARALRSAARAAAGGMLADLRADAYGHGVLQVARVVADAGIAQVLVDESAAARLREEGIDAVTSGTPDISPAALYGLPGSRTAPVMSLVGRVMSTKELRAGEAVSYGYTFRTERDTTVALVTGGYAQGVLRELGNRAHVQIAAGTHPIVGRVAMDVCVVELGDAPVQPGDEVVYFGGAGPARDALADWSRITGLPAAELVAVAGLKAVREWTD